MGEKLTCQLEFSKSAFKSESETICYSRTHDYSYELHAESLTRSYRDRTAWTYLQMYHDCIPYNCNDIHLFTNARYTNYVCEDCDFQRTNLEINNFHAFFMHEIIYES